VRLNNAGAFVFIPHAPETAEGEVTFGRTSFSFAWLTEHIPSWEMVGYDHLLNDLLQLVSTFGPGLPMLKIVQGASKNLATSGEPLNDQSADVLDDSSESNFYERLRNVSVNSPAVAVFPFTEGLLVTVHWGYDIADYIFKA
jgi:hypothetical protein